MNKAVTKPKQRPLTYKQKRFVTEFIKNGMNGTQAAIKAYPNQSVSSASTTASELVQKPAIQAEIEKALLKHEADADFAVGRIVETANLELDSRSATSVLKASEIILELHGYRRNEKPTIGLQVNQFFGKSRSSKFVPNNTTDDIT